MIISKKALALWFAGALAVFTALAALLLPRLAHADTGPPPAPDPVGWLAYAGIAIAAAGGLVKLMEVVLPGLRWLAPRTQTTIDDTLRDDVQLAHDKLDSLLKLVGGFIPATGVPIADKPAPASPQNVVAMPARNPQTGNAFLGVLAALTIAGVIAAIVASCATTKAAASSGAVAFVECEDGHLDPKALVDAKALARAELAHLITGSGAVDTAALKADLAPIKSDLLKCAWAGAVAAFGAVVQPTPGTAVSALTSLGPPPAAVRAQFQVAARVLGWAPVKLASGEVL